MPRFAQIDRSQTPPIVIGFYDTDLIDYPNLPPTADLVELSTADWDNRMAETRWIVVNGALVSAPPLPPTASQLLTEKIAAGIAITSTATPALNATYALDATALSQIQSAALDAASGLGLPGGSATFTHPDAAGQPHDFTEPQIIAFYKAMRDLLSALNTQATVMDRGGSAAWPAQTADIP